MCGISGIYHTTNPSIVDERLLRAMSASIMHRGPDGDGYFLKENIGLAHQRLSIIDLQDGGQPIYNENRSITIVFNGEIYNYLELRKILLQKGHQFRTASDTEVIIHLYEEYGPDCLIYLVGMFAFALWDENRNRLFIARDRMGEKPLYYSLDNGKLIFSSEIKSILVHPEVKRKIRLDALDDYLAYGYVPAEKTIYQSINRLNPASYILADSNGINIYSYWKNTFSTVNLQKSEFDYVQEFNDLLKQSIALQLRSDVPVGAFLSGGVDSSLIVAIASEISERKIATFSVGFNERDYDDIAYAKFVAQHCGTDHNEILLADIDLTLLPEILRHFDQPFGDPSVVPTYYVSKEASKYVKVCLSGDAADELFGGYDRYRRSKFEAIVDFLPENARRLVFGTIANVLPNHTRGRGALARMAASGEHRWQAKVGAFDFNERVLLFKKEYHCQVDKTAWLFKDIFSRKGLDRSTLLMFADQLSYLPDDILVKVDMDAMRNGLEVRVPFLDHRIVEWANQLPLEMKIKGGQNKYILRRILSKYFPEHIVNRPKKGFGLPIRYWLKDKYFNYTKEILLSPNAKLSEYLDQSVIATLIEQNAVGKRDFSRRIWTLLCLEVWMSQSLTN